MSQTILFSKPKKRLDFFWVIKLQEYLYTICVKVLEIFYIVLELSVSYDFDAYNHFLLTNLFRMENNENQIV